MSDLDSMIAELINIRKVYGKNPIVLASTPDDQDPFFYDFTIHYDDGEGKADDDELAIRQPHVTILITERKVFLYDIGDKVIVEDDPVLPALCEATIVSHCYDVKGEKELYHIKNSVISSPGGWQISGDKLSPVVTSAVKTKLSSACKCGHAYAKIDYDHGRCIACGSSIVPGA